MSSETVANFFALVLLGGTLGSAVMAFRPSTRQALSDGTLQLTAAVAAFATAGSLYFSEIAGFIPCELCWFQRIAMYPLGVLLPVAAVRTDRRFAPYALILSSIGFLISAYHVQLQLFPDQSSMCELSNPCTGRWVEGLGFMTIPQMAGLSFALIAGLSLNSLFHRPKESP